MAMVASGSSSGPYSYSYRTYTLEEAVAKAGCGELSPSEVYHKLPASLQKEVDQLSEKQYGKGFVALEIASQRSVMALLADEIKKAKEENARPLTLIDALCAARDGKADAIKLYGLLPEEVKKVLDSISVIHGAADFCSATVDARRTVLDAIISVAKDADAGKPPSGTG